MSKIKTAGRSVLHIIVLILLLLSNAFSYTVSLRIDDSYQSCFPGETIEVKAIYEAPDPPSENDFVVVCDGQEGLTFLSLEVIPYDDAGHENQYQIVASLSAERPGDYNVKIARYDSFGTELSVSASVFVNDLSNLSTPKPNTGAAHKQMSSHNNSGGGKRIGLVILVVAGSALLIGLISYFALTRGRKENNTTTGWQQKTTFAPRFCSQCGAPRIGEEAFCGNCGHPFVRKSEESY